MRISFSIKAICALILVIFLTGARAFCQEPQVGSPPGSPAGSVDRRAYVRAAYESFYGTLYFLSGSDAFLNQLSPAERQQFMDLGNAIIKHMIKFDGGARAGDGNTSKMVKTKLHFSDVREDFILAPDQVERTAKMDGDIWFNLNIINDPKNSFGLMDAIQIMFHEFGHTLGEKKNQGLIDQVGAKMKGYLSGFYKEHALSPGLTARTFILPYLMFDAAVPADFQVEPVVLFDLKGKAIAAQLNVPNMRSPEQSYTSRTGQTYTRIALTPQIKVYDQKILLTWTVETKSYFVNAPYRFNYLDLYTNNEKAAPHLPIDPSVTHKLLHQFLDPQELVVRLATNEPPPIVLKNYAEAPLRYKATPLQNWIEPLRVTETKGGRIYFEAVVQSSENINQAVLIGQVRTDASDFPGEVEKLTQDYYRLRFSIPDSNAVGSEKMYLNGVGLNSQFRWDLPEQMQIPLQQKPSPAPTIAEIEIWSENRWQNIREVRSEKIDIEEMKMRFQFNNATSEMNHLEIDWMIQEEVLKNGTLDGNRTRPHLEIIPKNDLLQTLKKGTLWVEVRSRMASQYLAAEKGRDGYSVRDQGLRALVKVKFVNENLTSVTLPARLINNQWRSVFFLTKPRPRLMGAELCRSLF